MTSITVIGTGNMGQAIAAIAAKGGASVQIIARDAEKAGTAAAAIGATLGSGELGGAPTVVQLAGDDEAAKQQLAGVITAAGLKVADAGALSRARELEALGFLQMVLAVREQIGWTGGFAVHA